MKTWRGGGVQERTAFGSVARGARLRIYISVYKEAYEVTADCALSKVSVCTRTAD